MKFKSKIGLAFWIALAVVCILCAIGGVLFFSDGDRLMLFVFIVAGADICLMISFLLFTYYRFDDEYLAIRGSFLYSDKIPYVCVRSISPIIDGSLGPALSSMRYRIVWKIYGQERSVTVSPADAEGFLREMQHRAKVSCKTK